MFTFIQVNTIHTIHCIIIHCRNLGVTSNTSKPNYFTRSIFKSRFKISNSCDDLIKIYIVIAPLLHFMKKSLNKILNYFKY